MEINASNFFTSASCFDYDSSKDGSIDPISGTSMNQPSIDPIQFWSTRTVALGDAKQAGGDLSNPFAVICGVNQHSMQASDPFAAVGTQEVPLLTDIQLPDTTSARNHRHAGELYPSLDSPATSHEEELEDDHHEATAADGTRVAHTDSSGSSSRRRKRPRVSQPRLSWEERIEQLENYKKEHGDLLIPIRYKENPSLGKFVHNTREQYKLYQKNQQESNDTNAKPTKKCSLTAERIHQLEELGFAWSTERTKHQKEDWEARLQQLRDYKSKHGDCLVPHGYTEDPSFAEWVHRQRTTHANLMKEQSDQDDPQEEQTHKPHHPHHPLNPLVKHRMKLLEDLGFHFTVHADKWMEHWKELKAYREVHGNCMVPTHCTENPQLGRWVHTQRHQRRLQLKGKKSCMTDERVQLLDSLGFSWDVRHMHYNDKPYVGPFLFPGENPQHDYISSDSDSSVTGTGMDVADPTMASDRGSMLLVPQEQQNSPNSNGDIFPHGMTMV